MVNAFMTCYHICDVINKDNSREKRIQKRNAAGVSISYMLYFTNQEVITLNGKSLAQFLAETRKNSTYLHPFVTVVTV